MRLILITLAMTGLFGCKTDAELRAQKVAQDDAACRSYGAKPGSDAYVQCRMAADGLTGNTVVVQSPQASGPIFKPAKLQMPPPLTGMGGTRCVSRPSGGSVITDCR